MAQAVVAEEFGPASVLRVREVPLPQPGDGEVTIAVRATGVNFADIAARRGGTSGTVLPFVPGLDAAGTIVAVGAGVDPALAGTRVAAYAEGGSYRDVMTARAVLTYPLPDGVGDETGAALNLLVTAYNVVAAAQLRAGETVLIHAAAGGVGSCAVQLAAARGARVIAVAGSAEKCAFARELGAAAAIDPARDDLAAAVRAQVGTHGVDAVLDAVGEAVFAPSLALLAPFGRYVVYGQASGAPGRLSTDQLHRENRRLIGYSSGGYRTQRPAALAPTVAAVFALVARGELTVHVGARFALRDAADAHRLVESRGSRGKVVLAP